ncbi:MAG: hypothetical protein WC666_03255 [Candidatus Paceibacterota bacterium]|jgi:hypothetical protein
MARTRYSVYDQEQIDFFNANNALSASILYNASGLSVTGSTLYAPALNLGGGIISSAIWNGTAIAPIYGGTNQTSWATGDMLYASGVNTLAKLTIGGAGTFLISSGGIPAWSNTVAGDLIVTGNLTINGTVTTTTATTLAVDDITITMAKNATLDSQANGGGVILQGATNKTILWDSVNTNWTSSEHFNILTGKDFKMNNVTRIASSGAATLVGITTTGAIALNASGGVTTNQTSIPIVDTTATTINIGGAGSTVTLGAGSGTLTLRNPTIVGTTTSANLWNTVATTVNAFGTATAISIGAVTGTLTINNATTVVTGNLQVNGGTLSSSGALTISPTTTLTLNSTTIFVNPSGKQINPVNGYDINLGQINKKYLSLHAAELWVETLVAQDTMATIGGRIIIAPTTTLFADLTSAATTIQVQYNNLSSGDFAYLESGGKIEFIKINSAATPTITHVYNFNNTGSVYSSSHANDRSWNLYADGANTEINDAVYFGNTGGSWTSCNLNIVTAGVYTATLVWEYWSGLAWASFVPTSFTDFKSIGKFTITLGTLSGWAATTVNTVSAFWVRCRISAFTSWTTLPRHSGPAVAAPYTYTILRDQDGSGANEWLSGDAVVNTGTVGDGFIDLYSLSGVNGGSTAGPTIVGNVRFAGGTLYSDYTEHWAIGNLIGHYGYGVATYGAGFGQYSNNQSFITIDATNGFRILNRAASVDTTIAQWDSSGNIVVGQVAASKQNIQITSGAVNFRLNTTTIMSLNTSGFIQIGQTSAGISNIYIDSNSIHLRTASTDKIVLDTSGNINLTGAIVMGTAGNFHAVSTAALSNDTGWWLDYNTGTPTFRIGTVSTGTLSSGIYWSGSALQIKSTNMELTAAGNLWAQGGGFGGTSAVPYVTTTAYGLLVGTAGAVGTDGWRTPGTGTLVSITNGDFETTFTGSWSGWTTDITAGTASVGSVTYNGTNEAFRLTIPTYVSHRGSFHQRLVGAAAIYSTYVLKLSTRQDADANFYFQAFLGHETTTNVTSGALIVGNWYRVNSYTSVTNGYTYLTGEIFKAISTTYTTGGTGTVTEIKTLAGPLDLRNTNLNTFSQIAISGSTGGLITGAYTADLTVILYWSGNPGGQAINWDVDDITVTREDFFAELNNNGLQVYNSSTNYIKLGKGAAIFNLDNTQFNNVNITGSISISGQADFWSTPVFHNGSVTIGSSTIATAIYVANNGAAIANTINTSWYGIEVDNTGVGFDNGYNPVLMFYGNTGRWVIGKRTGDDNAGFQTAGITSTDNIVTAGSTDTLTNKTLSTGSTWNGNVIITTYGGTGLASYTAGDLIYYVSGTTLSKLAIGTVGKIIRSTGTAPAWTTTTFADTYAAGTLLYAGTTNTVTGLTVGTNTQILTSNGTIPVWAALSTLTAPTRGETVAGVGGIAQEVAVTVPSFTAGNNKLLVFVNGVLMRKDTNSGTTGTAPYFGSSRDKDYFEKAQNGTACTTIAFNFDIAAGGVVQWILLI